MILLPVPQKMEEGNAQLMLQRDSMIVIDVSCPQGAFLYARLLQDEIRTWAGLTVSIGRGTFREGDILLKVDDTLGDQHYTLEIKEEGAYLCGGSLSAMGWAVQTLRQIVRQSGGLLQQVAIDDEPDIKNRGFFFDITRGRILSLETLKWLVDTMAFYKMNQLQLYVEHTYLFRDLTEVWRDDTPLTAEEILELDQYCYDRGIELVPSLSTFGHLCKLLQTKTFEPMCELPESTGDVFSFRDRMIHHTVNVSNADVLPMIKGLIGEYMHLFRSDKFNICADETFDLGKGKSKALAEEKGIGSLYMDYIMELFGFLIENGKKPMFWGDIIAQYPEKCSLLPKEVVCLTWGYSATQSDREAKILHGAGAVQYLCPGACGWNTWVNAFRDSYENIHRMCSYGRQYGAIGILNTEWGDFGHINQPIFSIPGMIYGAVWCWGENVPDYRELNRQISVLEFGDSSGQLLNFLGDVNGLTIFSWNHVVTIKEGVEKKVERDKLREVFGKEDMTKVPECNRRVLEMKRKLYMIGRSMDSRNRGILECVQMSLEAIRVWNEVGLRLCRWQKGEKLEDGMELAGDLEKCLRSFKELWCRTGKEADLARVSEVFYWYADVLRKISILNHRCRAMIS